jgi:tetratricopeptide (TPR) repeat protein
MTGRMALLLCSLLAAAAGQVNIGSGVGAIVRVRVSFVDGGACQPSTGVALIGSAGFSLAEEFLNNQCVAEFFDVPAGDYRVQLSGEEVAGGDTEFFVRPGMTQNLEIEARHMGRSGQIQGPTASAFVSVGELGIPSAAEKEFKKANNLISKQQWARATERLRRAIAIYPQYAGAYNNLGAAYARMGDMAGARASLEKAITLNDHLALAYVNLGRMSFMEKDFPGVEAFIGKALSLAAPDAAELTLLAYAQLADGHLDQTIATGREAHRSQVTHHASVHLLAAKADKLEGKDEDWAGELQQFLNEEPTGKRADQVRHALANLHANASAP